MYLVIADRNALLEQFPKGGAWAEIGVYRGDFSNRIVQTIAPDELVLIDNWRFDAEEHNPFSDVPENMSAFSGKIHWEHFGDDANATQEQNYQYVKARFAPLDQVKVVRANSIQGIQALPDHHFDTMYVDANHQYEYVLRDLIEVRKKLKPGGIILLNDFYEGPGGAEQNLGVMGAANTFVKRYDYHYLAMSLGAYCDVALTADLTSPYVRQFLQNLNDSQQTFVGISDCLVANIRYRQYRKANGDIRYVPVL